MLSPSSLKTCSIISLLYSSCCCSTRITDILLLVRSLLLPLPLLLLSIPPVLVVPVLVLLLVVLFSGDDNLIYISCSELTVSLPFLTYCWSRFFFLFVLQFKSFCVLRLSVCFLDLLISIIIGRCRETSSTRVHRLVCIILLALYIIFVLVFRSYKIMVNHQKNFGNSPDYSSWTRREKTFNMDYTIVCIGSTLDRQLRIKELYAGVAINWVFCRSLSFYIGLRYSQTSMIPYNAGDSTACVIR